MDEVFKKVEEVYFHDWKRYESILYTNRSYRYLSLLESIITLLLAMKENYELLVSAKDEQIEKVKQQDDPKLWRSIENYRLSYQNTVYVLNILGNNQSQIDSSRRLIKTIEKDKLFDIEIVDRIKEKYLDAFEIKFVNNFRNYLQHYSVPNIHWQFEKRFTTNETEYNLVISSNELLENNTDCFKSESKKYIKQNKVVKIDQVIGITIENLYLFYSELFHYVFSCLDQDLFDYLYIIECKNQIVKRLRKEKYISTDEEIEKATNVSVEKLLSRIGNPAYQTFDLLYDIHSLVKHIRV